jgi:predicted nucleotidyltransferase
VPLPDSALGFLIDVVSCEDLIVLKLLAWRILDRVDVAELLKANRSALDFAYLGAWIRDRKLEQRFAEAWNDAFPGEPSPM